MTEIVAKKTRGPRKARNKVQEMTFSSRAFVKAIEGFGAVAAAKYTIEQSQDLADLLVSLNDASDIAKQAHRAFEPHYTAMKREADLIRANAEQAAMLKQMAEALRVAGQSDKIPETLRVDQTQAPVVARRRGRPPLSAVASSESHAAA